VAKRTPPMSRVELLQGTLDLIILQTLRWGPRHGYGIGLMIRAASHNALQVDAGSLYPALHRLERQGAVAAESDVTDKNQRVRVYRLTAKGHRRLTAERSRWTQFNEAMAGIFIRPEGSET
jgi:PadR family transcriptional regulator PadR